jgi:multidrug transporter EmrE-like cation transporter
MIPGFLDLVPPLVGFIFQDLVLGCTLFLGASLFLDRKIQAIEHSIPYAACYGWGLSTSMIGFQILLNRKFHSVLVHNVVLSVYSVFLLWCFSQMASRITNKHDESSFMLPGFFAVEMFQVF